ncbi:MAG: GPR endopeptidase [Bacilli bacterium]|nr:GPR endopeptidase [Bacilli bacterium]
MEHDIDLSKYQLRTDLAIEAIGEDKIEGISCEEEKYDDIKITNVYVDEIGSKKIGKKIGDYITIEFTDITDYNRKEKVKDIFSLELKKLLKKISINDDASCLIIGLGNDKSTPDALGPLTISNILVTNHLFLYGNVEDGFRKVSAISPGVMGTTGIETSDLITSIINSLTVDFVIVIDALASQSIERVNRTIQMTDTGIHPGSGIGNKRKEISKDTIGKPVIAIGVPTVVDAVTIVSDTINYMYKHFSYTKDTINKPSNRLTVGNVNYLKKDVIVDEELKHKLFGMIGSLNDDEVKQLIFEVLTPIGYNLMVTPKEVDFEMEKLSDIIGNGINRALHKNVNNL